MSEPDKKSDSGVEGSAVVLVEQPAASRHKQPFRSSEFQEETADLHHKRSKAPSVPLSSERLHTSAAKKLSHVKKRDSSPETITLAAMDAEPKVGTRSPSQPIPAQLSETSIISDASDKIGSGKKDDDDITEEIAELRSPESTSRTNWESPPEYKKKEVSWRQVKINDHTGFQLQRSASVGPCFYPTTPSGRPSGIAISIPRKSIRSVREFYGEQQSAININIAKKWQPSKSKSVVIDEIENKGNQNEKSTSFFASLKEKISNISDKIKSCF